MVDLKQEHFYIVLLNNSKEFIKNKLLFIGTINASIVHPREIFKEAYLSSASYIICIHNHPSGNLEPSIQDIQLTEKLIQIGRFQSIPIIDHIIVSSTSYFSFYENNIVKFN
ncbi:MAG: RadC family protein [Bacilli bacterium]